MKCICKIRLFHKAFTANYWNGHTVWQTHKFSLTKFRAWQALFVCRWNIFQLYTRASITQWFRDTVSCLCLSQPQRGNIVHCIILANHRGQEKKETGSESKEIFIPEQSWRFLGGSAVYVHAYQTSKFWLAKWEVTNTSQCPWCTWR